MTASPAASSIEIKGLGRAFGNVEVLRDVDLTVSEGEFVVFVGPSGSGKSTLLRLLAGLDQASTGSIAMDGQDVTCVPPVERGVAMVFQNYALYPHLNVRDNIAFGLKIAGMGKAERHRRAEEVAALLQLTPYLDRRPKALSGGQRQRVAIGRAIAKQPRVFLFDEPLSNLDAELRVHMRLELARLHAELKATMIYVTHDQVEAMTLADRIVVLRDGRIEQVGEPQELYANPANSFVAGFIGSPRMNMLPATIAAGDGGALLATAPIFRQGGITLAPSAVLSPGSKVTLGIRPGHVVLADAATSDLKGRIIAVERLGNIAFAYIGTDTPTELVAEVPNDTPLRTGEIVGVRLDPQRVFVFSEDGGRLV